MAWSGQRKINLSNAKPGKRPSRSWIQMKQKQVILQSTDSSLVWILAKDTVNRRSLSGCKEWLEEYLDKRSIVIYQTDMLSCLGIPWIKIVWADENIRKECYMISLFLHLPNYVLRLDGFLLWTTGILMFLFWVWSQRTIDTFLYTNLWVQNNKCYMHWFLLQEKLT